MLRRLCMPFVLIASCASVSWGHPGHGTTDPQSATHFTSEPIHLVALATAAAAISVASWFLMRHRNQPVRDQQSP